VGVGGEVAYISIPNFGHARVQFQTPMITGDCREKEANRDVGGSLDSHSECVIIVHGVGRGGCEGGAKASPCLEREPLSSTDVCVFHWL
jgi:hypothetical protein